MDSQREVNSYPSFGSQVIQGLLWMLAMTILDLVRLSRLVAGRRKACSNRTHLVIESGERGWELIEYQEIYESAREYLGNERVSKNIVTDRRRYLKTMRTCVKTARPTHYFYDPRTGSQKPLHGFCEAMCAAILFQWYGVVPIAWLTDLPVKAWRRQCIVLTARSGIIVTLMASAQIGRFIPHGRLTGPSLMAISNARISELESWRADRSERISSAIFSGSLYEPRETILIEIQDRLRAQGLDLKIYGRSLGDERMSNSKYWERLSNADIVVTTADQIEGPQIDPVGLPHLIFRYSETLATGSLLVAQEVPGIRRYFLPGAHFVSYETPEEAAIRIAYYLTNHEERLKIASAGAKRVQQLTKCHTYWVAIDSALGKESLI